MMGRIFEYKIDGRMTFVGQNNTPHHHILDHPLMVGYGIADDLEGFIDLTYDLMEYRSLGIVFSQTRKRIICIEVIEYDGFVAWELKKGKLLYLSVQEISERRHLFNSLEAAATAIFNSLTTESYAPLSSNISLKSFLVDVIIKGIIRRKVFHLFQNDTFV